MENTSEKKLFKIDFISHTQNNESVKQPIISISDKDEKKNMNPTDMAMQLLSDPKKLKGALVSLAVLCLTGLTTWLYIICKYWMYSIGIIPLYGLYMAIIKRATIFNWMNDRRITALNWMNNKRKIIFDWMNNNLRYR